MASAAAAQPVSRVAPGERAPRALHSIDFAATPHVQQAPLTPDRRAPIPSTKDHLQRDYNAPSRAAAKAVCDIAPFADATPATIVAVVQAASVTCVNENFDAVGAQAAAIFAEAKMVAIANAITAQSPKYPGNNDTQMQQLIMFLRAGYYVEFNQEAVADFGPALQAAIGPALDAFVASSHFDDVGTAHGAALLEFVTLIDSSSQAAHHIGTFVRILDNYGPGHAASGNMRTAVNNVFVVLYYASFDTDFVPALLLDGNDLPGAMRDFILDNHAADVGSTREYLLVNSAAELSRLLSIADPAFHARVHDALLALTAVFGIDHGRAIFLKIAEMVNYYDNAHCAIFGTCTALADLEALILPPEHARECSETLKVRSQGLTSEQLDYVCETVGDEEAYFHAMVQSQSIPVAGDNNTSLEMVIFNSSTDYEAYSGTFFGNSVDNGGIYLEGTPSAAGNQPRFIAFVATWITTHFEVWNLTHEYVHYLDGRFNFHGGFSSTPMVSPYSAIWYIEGVAEYISYSYRDLLNEDALALASGAQTLPLSTLFDNDYDDTTERVYPWGYLATRFMFERNRARIADMYDVVRVGDFAPGYRIWLDSVRTAYDGKFASWLACYVRDGGDTTVCNEEMDRIVFDDEFEGEDPPIVPDPEPEPEPVDLPECALYERQLGNGCKLSDLQVGSSNQVLWLYLYVPAGVAELTIKTQGRYGDVDMYGAYSPLYPTTTAYDHASTAAGNNETIVVATPTAGYYNIRLSPKSDYFSGVTAYATWTMQGDPDPDPDPEPEPGLPECEAPLAANQLGNDCQRSGIGVAAANGVAWYNVYVPTGVQTLTIRTEGGDGDVDLYGAYSPLYPTVTEYDHASTDTGNAETITIATPTAGYYNIGLRPKSTSFSGVRVFASWTMQVDPDPDPDPEPGLPECEAPLAANQLGNDCQRSGVGIAAANGVAWYYVYVPAGVQTLTIRTHGGSGDVDLYGAYSPLYPTTTDYDHASTDTGNSETITIATPTAGYYNVGLRPKSASFSGVAVFASWTMQGDPDPEPEPGLPECEAPLAANQLGNDCQRSGIGIAAANGVAWYYVYVPAGVQTLTIRTEGGDGDVDLYGAYSPLYPTTTDYDHASTDTGNSETITIATPTAGYYNVGLRPKSASFSGVAVFASWTMQGDPDPDPDPEPGLPECEAPLAANQLGNDCQRSDIGVAAANGVAWFYIYVPAGVETLTIRTQGGSGDVDLYGAYSPLYPTITDYDHVSMETGNTETITIATPTAGYYNVGLRPKSGSFSGVAVFASWTLQ